MLCPYDYLYLTKLQSAVSVEVRFAGGDSQLMQDWLGLDLVYQSQGEGDLGSRMTRSLRNAFLSGVENVIIISTDCPGVNALSLQMCAPPKDLYYDLLRTAIRKIG